MNWILLCIILLMMVCGVIFHINNSGTQGSSLQSWHASTCPHGDSQHGFIPMIYYVDLWFQFIPKFNITSSNSWSNNLKKKCHIRRHWFVFQFEGRWRRISNLQDMGFVCNNLNYLKHEEIAKKKIQFERYGWCFEMVSFQNRKFVKTNSKLGILFLIPMNDFYV